MIQPEFTRWLPQLIYGAIHQQPAFVAFTQNLYIPNLQRCGTLGNRRLSLSRLQSQRGHRSVRCCGVTCVLGQLRQIWWHLQRAGFFGTFVVDLVFLNDRTGRQGHSQANQAGTGEVVLHFHAMSLECFAALN